MGFLLWFKFKYGEKHCTMENGYLHSNLMYSEEPCGLFFPKT